MPHSDDPTCCPECGAPFATGFRLCPACILIDPEAQDEEDDADSPHNKLGSYTLLEEISRGGMGVVYRARQDKLKRIVALKVLPGAAFASAPFRARFQQEAETAARLNHPGIVAVHEVGTAHGQPFLSMDFIDGPSLAERLADGKMTAGFAAQILREVARAVAHAHDHGVAHRDLKPSNIVFDPDNRPILTDFGLARFLDCEASQEQTLDLAGSPPYLPPERIASGVESDPVKEDVYGLGAVLYHCLTGRPPFTADSISALLAAVSEEDPVPPRRLNRSVPVDLETICLKCLEKPPSARYGTAAEVADELDRFLRGEPILARPLAPAGHLLRWIRRRPLTAAMACMLVLSITGGTVVSLLGWQHAAANAREAQATAERRRVDLYSGNLAAASAALQSGNRLQVLSFLSHSIPAEGESDLRGPEWFLLNSMMRPRSVFTVQAQSHIITSLAWKPAGSALLTASQDGALRLWSHADGVLEDRPQDLLKPGGKRIQKVQWLPDGLAFLSSEGAHVRCRRPGGEKPLWEIPGVHFSLTRDALTLAVSTGGAFPFDPPGQASLWKLDTDHAKAPILQQKFPHSARAISLSPDGRWLALGLAHAEHVDAASDVLLGRVDAPETPFRHLKTQGAVWNLAFSGDSKILSAITTAADGKISCFETEGGREVVLPSRNSARVWSISALADSSDFLTTSSDRSLDSLSLDPSRCHELPMAHDNEIWAAAIHPSGNLVASGDKDGVLKLHPWPLPPAPMAGFPRHPHFRYVAPLWSPDGKSLLVCEPLQQWRNSYWNPADGTTAQEPNPFYPLGVTRDGISSHLDPTTGRLELCTPAGPTRVFEFPPECRPARPDRHHAAASPDGSHVAWFSESGHAIVIDVKTAQPQAITDFCRETPLTSGLSPGGRFLAAATWEELIVHDFSTGKTFRLPNNPHWAKAIAFYPDNTKIITGGADSHIMVRRLPDLALITQLNGHLSEVSGLAISPDGKTLVSTEIGDGLRFWRFDTAHEVLHLPLPHACEDIVFSPDGQNLAVTICPPATLPTHAQVIVIPCPR